ncbi:ribosomal RNA small subunit methyltransferase A [candidate division KSB1 bacterium]|nr:ribosomal RNA small subunit methyltransferase A [candidate division KSB1 bacterium]
MPKKSLGQNFLRDDNIARKIVDSLEIVPQDIILEIGPGFGKLTKFILDKTHHYIGVELDNRLALHLENQFGNRDGFTLIHDDFLKLDLSQFTATGSVLKIVGNIPYHITSPIIFRAIQQRRVLHSMTLMLQKEVAKRVVSTHKTKLYGILSVMSQAFSVPELLFPVSRHVFYPKPKIESAVVCWKFINRIDYGIDDEASFIRMVKSIFNQRRKVLRNSLKQYCPENKIRSLEAHFVQSRPEELSVAELVALWKKLNE